MTPIIEVDVMWRRLDEYAVAARCALGLPQQREPGLGRSLAEHDPCTGCACRFDGQRHALGFRARSAGFRQSLDIVAPGGLELCDVVLEPGLAAGIDTDNGVEPGNLGEGGAQHLRVLEPIVLGCVRHQRFE